MEVGIPEIAPPAATSATKENTTTAEKKYEM
jgi:hypothetical protein